ncbi:MAG: DUF507 family protein [Magnetococcales bacterium]|uniref:DUF507 family protein n=2 Tax=Candidatus Magnetobacterium casense TaxID=1455061 RepID=A0ABS6S071_9BACT|nr:DUF507 family protein [Nitrospirota bacterium]MBV6341784.1 DUF507 family protein [Candidatus Magnetobacterium casensis]
MMLSDDKITHMSHVLLKGLSDKGLVHLKADEGKVRKEIRKVIVDELRVGQEIDDAVRAKINTLSKKVVEGSAEWDILYKKLFAEEERKKGRS